MRSNQVFSWSLVALAQLPPSTLAQSLQSVLIENDFNRFASILQGSAVLEYGDNLIIYAPTDASLEAVNQGTISGRGDGDSNVWSASHIAGNYDVVPPHKPRLNTTSSTKTTETRPGPTSSTTSTPARLLARQDGTDQDSGSSCGIVRETWLRDPVYVNLGPGHNQTIVEANVCGMSRPLIFSGLGASVKVTADDIPFDRGVIRPVNGRFTLPRPLSETLGFVGAGRFLTALETTGLLSEIDGLPSITVLAVTDAAFKRETDGLSPSDLEEALKRHILVGDFPPAYTPLVQDGGIYTTLDGQGVVAAVSGIDEIVSFGGAVVSAADAVTKNGVVHTINKVISADVLVPAPQEPSSTTTSPLVTATSTEGPISTSTGVVTAGVDGLVGKIPSSWQALGFTLFAGVAVIVRYC